MRKHIDRRPWGLLAVTVLLSLAACSPGPALPAVSAVPAVSAIPRAVGDCIWEVNAGAWVDADGNGLRGADEAPLPNVKVYVDDTPGTGDEYVRWSSVTGPNGQAELEMLLAGCPQTACDVYVHPPAGYQATTPDRINFNWPGDLASKGPEPTEFHFGFRYSPDLGTPTPPPVARIDCSRPAPGGALTLSVNVTDVAVAPEGSVWVTTNTDLVLHFDPDGTSAETYRAADGVPFQSIGTVAAAADGTVWVGTRLGADRGSAHFDGSVWKVYRRGDGLVSNEVEDIAVGPDGAVWFATAGGYAGGNTFYRGVSRFDPATGVWVTDAIPADGLTSDDYDIDTILPAWDGSVWFFSYGAVYELKPSSETGGEPQWIVHKRNPSELFGGVEFIQRDSAVFGAQLWFIGRGPLDTALLGVDADGRVGTYSHATTGGAVFGGDMQALAAASGGSLWIGLSTGGILQFIPDEPPAGASGGTWIHYTSVDGLAFDDITSIAAAPDGAVWIGGDDGALARCVPESK